MAAGVHCKGTGVVLGHGGMVPGGALCRTGLYWAVLGCPGIAVRHRTLALSCSEESLTQTGVHWYALE